VLGASASVGALLADDVTAVCATPRLLVAHALQSGARSSGGASGGNDLLLPARPASARFAALSEGSSGVSALARSPDGAIIAAAERGGGVLLVDAHTLARRATLALTSCGAVRARACVLPRLRLLCPRGRVPALCGSALSACNAAFAPASVGVFLARICV
jgi:hypothetical protein